MENPFGLSFQDPGHHGLRDPIGHGGHPEHPGPLPWTFRDLHRTHRRREVAARGQSIPDLVKVALQVLLEIPERHLVHAGRTPVRLDLLIRLPDSPLRDHERLVR
jgi:hypothetical protein